MSLRPKQTQIQSHLSMQEVRLMLQASSENKKLQDVEDQQLIKEFQRRGLKPP